MRAVKATGIDERIITTFSGRPPSMSPKPITQAKE
jgi:hypothetical protein